MARHETSCDNDAGTRNMHFAIIKEDVCIGRCEKRRLFVVANEMDLID
jgi:hypothetical protein